MSLQDDNLNDNKLQNENLQAHHSAPESLGQVLSSLQNILEHKRFPFSNAQDKSGSVLEPVIQPFSEQADPLILDDGNLPLLQPEDTANDDILIPVLDDIIFKGLDDDAIRDSEVESQLKQLRSELEAIVGDIMDEARQQFESDQPQAEENCLQRFLRELGQRNLK